MKKSPVDIAQVQELHQAGLYAAAKEGYLAILKTHPEAVEALHSLAILSAQVGDFNAAKEYLTNAIHYQPDNPALYLNLGNILKTLGEFKEAATTLLEAIEINPDYSAALNNLGTVYYAQNNLDDAIHYYRLAIHKHPDYVDAYYNLGLALGKQNKPEEAIKIFETILELTPEHAAAHFQLGCLLLQTEKISAAENHFLVIEQTFPHHFETQTNLATCYLKQGALKQAKTHYKNALDLIPNDTQILFNLGVINMQLGLTDIAIQYYQRTLQTNPDNFAAHNNLGVAFLSKQHPGYALHHFKEAQRLQPDNQAIRYTVQMLSQDQRLLASPPEYIKNLFDTYADHYEIHLQQALDYKVPEQLRHAINIVLKNPPPLDILDLGCGTGLCGIPFKPLSKTLTGIDLSPKMLEFAATKNIYTELTTADLETYLNTKTSAYDLLIAGDVFVYIGELTALFHAAHKALRPKGLLSFNSEITEKEDYTMNQSGRFSHQKKYLDTLAEQQGFKIAYYQTVITRQQNNTPVHGHLYVLQKV
jgi:predicted TPR repeat methyltransferase